MALKYDIFLPKSLRLDDIMLRFSIFLYLSLLKIMYFHIRFSYTYLETT